MIDYDKSYSFYWLSGFILGGVSKNSFILFASIETNKNLSD